VSCVSLEQTEPAAAVEPAYVELMGPLSDNNAATRSNGYQTVLGQYPDLEKVASDIANWDRTQGRNKMQSMLQSHPDIKGVISGNDEMALGAIAALKQEGKLEDVVVGGFDGSPDAVDAVRAGEWVLRFCFDISGPFEIGLGIS